DLDGDGDLDIVLTDISHTVGFLPNNGDATFAEVQLFRLGSGAHEVAVGDLNGDGALDLVAPNFAADSVSVLLNRCADIQGDLDGDGSVGASDLLILLVNWGRCGNCDDCPADLNGDCNVGAADLLILLANWG
ncbi:MAG: FG-GAP-like repeat-containing protein, partial [Phycisphaerales bacterium]